MSSHTPEDWPRQFTHHLNARDLEAGVALYAPDARFVARAGETVVGRDQIRGVLAGLIGAHTRLQSRVIKAVTVGEVALLYTDFQGTTVDVSGRQLRPVTRRSRSSAVSPMAPGSSSWATPTAVKEMEDSIKWPRLRKTSHRRRCRSAWRRCAW